MTYGTGVLCERYDLWYRCIVWTLWPMVQVYCVNVMTYGTGLLCERYDIWYRCIVWTLWPMLQVYCVNVMTYVTGLLCERYDLCYRFIVWTLWPMLQAYFVNVMTYVTDLSCGCYHDITYRIEGHSGRGTRSYYSGSDQMSTYDWDSIQLSFQLQHKVWGLHVHWHAVCCTNYWYAIWDKYGLQGLHLYITSHFPPHVYKLAQQVYIWWKRWRYVDMLWKNMTLCRDVVIIYHHMYM